MQVQVIAPNLIRNGKQEAPGDIIEIEGDEVPKLYQGKLRAITETIVPQSEAASGHTLLRITTRDALILRDDKICRRGEIIEVPTELASNYNGLAVPADKPNPVILKGSKWSVQ